MQIPGYTISHVLGKGGMATVYLAVQEIFERQVALKVMSAGLAEDPSFGQRFLREARIVSQLVHPHIITVYDVGVHGDLYYLSMEYIDGPDLKQARSQLNLRQKIQVVKEVASALVFAGDKGYVHRDIKPENILLRSGTLSAVLMDFGIARAAETDHSVTQTGTALGTPHYMSPEQAKGLLVDHRSDLYSLGVVFYYLLMGAVPFHADSAVAIGIKHITEPVPELLPHLQPLQTIIDRLMAKRPEERYANAADFLAALTRLDINALEKREKAYLRDLAKNGPAQPQPLTEAAPTLLQGQAEQQRSVRSPTHAQARKMRFLPVLGACLGIGALVLVASYYGRDPYAGLDVPVVDLVPPLPEAVPSPGRTRPAEPQPRPVEVLQRFQRRVQGAVGASPEPRASNPATLEQTLAALRETLIAQPQNREAQAELQRLGTSFFAAANARFDEGRFAQAQQLLQQGEAWFPELSEPQHLLRQRLQQAGRLQLLYQQAQTQKQQQQWVSPRRDNALHSYQEMLKLDANLLLAKQGLAELEEQLLAQANLAYFDGDWDRAEHWANQVLGFNADSSAARLLLAEISQFRTPVKSAKPAASAPSSSPAAVRADKPKPVAEQSGGTFDVAFRPSIRDLRVEGKLLTGINAGQRQTIKSNRTLVVSFDYEHFPGEPLLLRAKLSGDHLRSGLEAPVLIADQKGNFRLRLDQPRQAFAAGEYQLAIYLDGDMLVAAGFSIE